ncbi:hypothetical protein CEK25_013446 [Fusarium fujikuroi]|nr:hypothetical protein CEK25_013446 [Fusarium fujikuroi]
MSTTLLPRLDEALSSARYHIRFGDKGKTEPITVNGVTSNSHPKSCKCTGISYHWANAGKRDPITVDGQTQCITPRLANDLEKGPYHWASAADEVDPISCRSLLVKRLPNPAEHGLVSSLNIDATQSEKHLAYRNWETLAASVDENYPVKSFADADQAITGSELAASGFPGKLPGEVSRRRGRDPGQLLSIDLKLLGAILHFQGNGGPETRRGRPIASVQFDVETIEARVCVYEAAKADEYYHSIDWRSFFSLYRAKDPKDHVYEARRLLPLVYVRYRAEILKAKVGALLRLAAFFFEQVSQSKTEEPTTFGNTVAAFLSFRSRLRGAREELPV